MRSCKTGIKKNISYKDNIISLNVWFFKKLYWIITEQLKRSLRLRSFLPIIFNYLYSYQKWIFLCEEVKNYLRIPFLSRHLQLIKEYNLISGLPIYLSLNLFYFFSSMRYSPIKLSRLSTSLDIKTELKIGNGWT